MINIYITPESRSELYAEINNKINGIKQLKTIESKNKMMSAAFSISALKFVKTTNMISRSAKSKFHHIYEWDEVGTESGRLFRIIKRQNSGGSASIYYKFTNSRKKSPISPELKVPGKTGRVVKNSGIFKRKAEIMENGTPVSFVTRKTIAIPSGRGISFIPAGKNIVIKNPGGAETAGSFNSFYRMWWETNFAKNFEQSGIIERLESNLSRTLSRKNAGPSAARNAINSVLNSSIKVGSII